MIKSPYKVTAINAFNDNYIWLITAENSHRCLVVDPGDAKPVIDYMTQHKLELEGILITHHHADHIGGVADLLAHACTTVPVYGAANEAQDVVTHPLSQGDSLTLATFATTCQVLDIPGHTLGHIAYATPSSVFCGDALFSGGCGRMFEGTPVMFQQSLARLATLPPQTKMYCAHEYTLANLAFAKLVSPHCTAVEARISAVEAIREQGSPSIPSTIATELSSNPFLRLNQPQIQQAIAKKFATTATDNEVDNFAKLRRWKDQF